MGLVYADITLSNPREGGLESIKVKALVDTGAAMLCIPDHVAVQLKLEKLEEREAVTDHGVARSVPYVGPIQVKFQNRNSFSGALVIGDQVLLGAIPMEDMDLVISPLHNSITVNPKSPNIPTVLVKGLRKASEIKAKVA